MASEKQIEANRRNALNSTGPQTPEGKAASSRNALKHGLTAEHAVVSIEDRDQFDDLLRSFQDQFQPVGPLETLLVDQIVMAAWRLTRVRAMETGLYELRLIDNSDEIDEDYRNLSPHHRLAYVFGDDCRRPDAFTTLARYETRAERAFYRALHELQRLQAARPNPPCQTNPIPPVSPSPCPRVSQPPELGMAESPHQPSSLPSSGNRAARMGSSLVYARESPH
jgi:hypothetical protein